MKQLIFSIVIILCGLHISIAQNIEGVAVALPKEKISRYSGLVEVIPYFGLQNWGMYFETNSFPARGVCIGTAHGIQLVDRYFVGLGTGINIVHNKVFVPVYYSFRHDFSKSQARPFISTSLGMQFGYYKENGYYSLTPDESSPSYGLWSNIMFGYRFKNRWYVSAGVTLQNAMCRIVPDQIYGALGIIAGAGIKF